MIAFIGSLNALLLPAVMSAHESVRRVTCTSRLQQIAIAVHQHHSGRQRLPSAWQVAGEGMSFAFGWVASLLPGLEESELFTKIGARRKPSLGIAGAAARFTLAVLLCPSDLIEPTSALMESDDNESDECESTSRHVGGASFVRADGRVEMVSDDIDPHAYRDLAKRLAECPRGLRWNRN